MQLIAKSIDISPVEHNIFESMDPHGPLGERDLTKVKIKIITAAICNTIHHTSEGAKIHALPILLKLVFEAIVNARRKG